MKGKILCVQNGKISTSVTREVNVNEINKLNSTDPDGARFALQPADPRSHVIILGSIDPSTVAYRTHKGKKAQRPQTSTTYNPYSKAMKVLMKIR